MLSAQELEYVKGLVGAYYKKGYKYYLCHTVTESNNVYDVYVYFSKEEIKAITSDTFDVTDGLLVKIDSSQRNDNSYNGSTHSRDEVSNVSSIVSVHQAEFIYTNAISNYSTNLVVNPDLNYSNLTAQNTHLLGGVFVMLIIAFLFSFVASILRLRR